VGERLAPAKAQWPEIRSTKWRMPNWRRFLPYIGGIAALLLFAAALAILHSHAHAYRPSEVRRALRALQAWQPFARDRLGRGRLAAAVAVGLGALGGAALRRGCVADAKGLRMAELYERQTGYCKGKGERYKAR